MKRCEKEEGDDKESEPEQDKAGNGALARHCGRFVGRRFSLYLWGSHAQEGRRISRQAGLLSRKRVPARRVPVEKITS
jgi:hypothetical protein